MNRRDLLKGFLSLPVAGVLAKAGLSLPPPEPEPEPDDLLTRDWDDDDDDEWDDDGDGDVEYSDDWGMRPVTVYSRPDDSLHTFSCCAAMSSTGEILERVQPRWVVRVEPTEDGGQRLVFSDAVKVNATIH